MRKLSSFIGLMLLSALAFAQKDTLIYYPNGKIMERAQKANGNLHGTYIRYFENGIISIQGSYENGKQSGEWTQNYQDGNIGRKIRFENGQATYLQEYRYGKVVQEGSVLNDKKHGEWKLYFITEDYLFKNGPPKTRVIEHYENDALHGEHKEFHEDGSVSRITDYNEGKITRNKSFWANGQVISDCTYVNGELHGQCFSYEENGSLWSENNYVNGKNHGVYKRYKWGVLKEEGYYENGFKHGFWRSYENDHNPKSVTAEGNYVKGQKEGRWKENRLFTGNYAIGEYRDGKLTGEWKLYKWSNDEYVKSEFH
jgi:antitoxin component YwqK of YwqJK toxin-antitoxin module